MNALKPKVSTLESKVATLENKPTAPSPKAYIVETWHNGNNWYRRYSDGFIEQGGKKNRNYNDYKVTLHVPFNSNKYTVVVGMNGSNAGFYVYVEDTSHFQIYSSPYDSNEYDAFWTAYGY